MDAHQQIVTWLRDAHAMEQSLESVLQRHIDDASDVPAIRERLKQHLEETREQARRIRACLESLGEQPSTMKSMAGSLMGAMQGMATGVFADELMKNLLADYAMEHFEIASYTSLLAAAEEAGLDQVAELARDLLAEEQAMAEWLRVQIPQVTRMYLRQALERTA